MIDLQELWFAYAGDFALNVPRLQIAAGESVALTGPTGSGKTTLLWLMAGLLLPLRGSVQIGGVRLSHLDEKQRRKFRVSRIGLVFQDLALIEYLTVLENILLPFRINVAVPQSAASASVGNRLISEVGLSGKSGRYPAQLSQGEQQRVALSRALVTLPDILLADEPTSSLDVVTSESILDLFFAEVASRGTTLVMSTHNRDILDRFDRVIDVSTFQEIH